jgi:transposase
LASKKPHDCEWRDLALELQTKLAELEAKLTTVLARMGELEHQNALAMKQIVGPKSERMPTPDDEAKKREGESRKRGGYTNPKKRKANAEALASLPTTVEPHPIAKADRRCPHCGNEVKPIGEGDKSVEYEWVPGRLVRRIHVVEVGRCPCKMHYARGPSPRRVREGCTYGPAFISKLIVDKCADATPIYRVEKAMRRSGIPISRSTLNSLVLLGAEVLEPLHALALAELRVDPPLQADETSFRLQTRSARPFVWTFLSSALTVYVFSESRSGDTAKTVLGGTTGSLTIDGFTGYNVVTDVDGRERTGCWSHARRYLFDALATAPEAREGLDIILDLFMVERKAKSMNIVGTPAHHELRQRRSTAILERIRVWREAAAPNFEPKSPMGIALRYMNNQWSRLTAFLADPKIPIHNNASEAALRIVALARKNSLFFGTEEAGRRFMVLYSLIATCERHDVNPEAYLADVLLRIQDHPKQRLGELLPHRWKQTYGTAFAVDRTVTPADAT